MGNFSDQYKDRLPLEGNCAECGTKLKDGICKTCEDKIKADIRDYTIKSALAEADLLEKARTTGDKKKDEAQRKPYFRPSYADAYDYK